MMDLKLYIIYNQDNNYISHYYCCAGSHDNAPVLCTLCGNEFENITSTSAFMLIHLHTDTDNSTPYKGFMMRYRATPPGPGGMY